MKKIVYLGNMTPLVEMLRNRPGVELAGWIAEKEDLGDPLFRYFFEKSGVPSHAVGDSEALSRALKELSFDLGILGNFGLLLTAQDLKTAPKGFVNLHLGLLPEHPGRHPIQNAISAVDKSVGVTLHRAVVKADAGPVIDRRATAMPESRRPEEVFQRLEILAQKMLEDNLERLLE